MKTKILSLISLSILSLVLLASMASATLTLTSSTSELSQDGGTFTINIAGGSHNATATATINEGSVNLITITNGGSGYTTAPTITISGPDGTGATATATINEGSVNLITITNGGSGYTTAPTVTIDSPTLTNVDLDKTTIKDSDGTEIIINLPTSPINLNDEGKGSFVVTYATTDFNFEFSKIYTIKINATDTSDSSNFGTISKDFEQTPFYTGENKGNLDVSDIKVDVVEGFGDDEEWYAFDEVKVTFNVDNRGSYDIENIEIKVCLWDEKECVFDEDDMDIDKDDFDLDKGDDQDVELTFKINQKYLNEGNSDYTLYIKAIGELDGTKAKDEGIKGEETGDWDSENNIEIITDDDFVVLGDFEINGMTLVDLELKDAVACGSELQLIADVWNIGDSDQDEVMVLIRNTELGISKKVTIGDIDSFDYEKLEATLEIPENAEAKYYTLEFLIYDEDNSIFETSEDDKAIFKVLIKVDGNCKVADSTKVTASLVTASPKAGEQLTVKTTITNTGDNIATYILNVADYSSWATLEDFEKSLTLVAGEQRDVELTFNVKDDVSGTKVFNIEVIEGTTVTKQPVQVTIEAQKSLFGNISLPENKYLWIIGAVNVLLIFAIIFVAIRLSRN